MIILIFYLLLCICISYIAIDIYNLTNTSPEIDITQIDFINENSFDSLINKQNPIFIYKANIQLPELFLDSGYASKSDIIDYISQLHSPLSFDQQVLNNIATNNICCTHFARTFIIQTKGSAEIQLYSSTQKHLLYLEPIRNGFQYGPKYDNIQNKEKYPLINQSKYVLVKIRQGQILSIPYNWSFSINDANSLIAVSHTISSKLLLSIV